MHRMIKPGQFTQRLAHQPARVIGKDNVVVTLGPVLLRHQLHMTGRGFPVDASSVHAWHEFPHSIEL